jgi:hypothetical protein
LLTFYAEAKSALTRADFDHGNDDYKLAFTFDFTARQSNTKSSDLTLTFPVALGSLQIGLSNGAIEDENYSQNTFKISRNFTQYKDLNCGGYRYSGGSLSKRPTGALPIRGSVGIASVIDEYFHLKHFSNGELADHTRKLEFKVMLEAGTKGNVTLTRANGEKIVANANGTGKRTDFHKLTIVITKNSPVMSEADRIKARTYYIVDITEKSSAKSEVVKDRQRTGRKTGRAPAAVFVPSDPSADVGIQQLRRSEENEILRELRDEIQELRAE